ncbi:TVP38/TMEM64 family protein [Microvirga sp. P5_D2]
MASSPLKYLPLALVVAALAAVFASGLHQKLSFDSFVQYHAELRDLVSERPVAMLGLYALVYVVAVILSLPLSAFLTTIGGYLFGWLIGGTAASLSATLGATCFFLIARTSLGQPFLRRAGSRIQGLAAGFRRQGFTYLLILRLIPLVPFWLTNLAAGFFRMRLRSFVLATQLGMLPVTFAFAFAGSGLDRVIIGHQRLREACLASGRTDCAIPFDAKSLLTPELLTALAVLGILASAPVAIRYWRGRKGLP